MPALARVTMGWVDMVFDELVMGIGVFLSTVWHVIVFGLKLGLVLSYEMDGYRVVVGLVLKYEIEGYLVVVGWLSQDHVNDDVGGVTKKDASTEREHMKMAADMEYGSGMPHTGLGAWAGLGLLELGPGTVLGLNLGQYNSKVPVVALTKLKQAK
ncbi:hypothetical protein Tco_0781921 [Tanacetum coccineum]